MLQHQKSSEDGFTYIEVVTAILIISMSGLILWYGLSQGIAIIEKIYQKNKETTEIARLEFLLREEIGQLGPDYWMLEYVSEFDGLYMDDDILCLETEANKFFFSSLSLIQILEKESGIEFEIKTSSGKDFKITATYGRFPFATGVTDDS